MQFEITKQKLLAIKVLVISMLFAFLCNKFFYFQKNIVDLPTLRFILDVKFLLPLLIGTVLNWTIESCKWYYLLNKNNEVKFRYAFLSVLSGVSVSVIMPNRAGEFLGRVFYLKSGDKVSLSVLSFYTSYTQQIVTILAGLISFYFWKNNSLNDHLLFQVIVPLISILYLSLFYVMHHAENFRIIKYVLDKFKISHIPLINIKDFLALFCLSIFRYCVFTLQLFFICKFMGMQVVTIDLLFAIFLLYFFNSFMPSYFITEIASRSLIAVFIFDFLGDKGISVVIPVFIIWVVNIALPALIGAFGIWKIRLNNKTP